MDRPPAPRQRIALIELFERDGRVGRAIDVDAWPLTLGRALDNDVVLDDPWVAAHHARFEAGADGGVTLQVLQTRNGINHDGQWFEGGRSVALPAAGGALQIGATRLRLRLPGEVLAAERPLPGLAPGQRLLPLLLMLALLALVLAGHWIGLDPGAGLPQWLPVVVGVPVVLVGWCGGWALMSKLFQHRFDFGGHLRIALPWMLAMVAVDMGVPQLGAMFAAPWFWHLAAPLQGLLGALLIRAHLQHLLPLHPRAVTASVAALALSGAALSTAITYRSTDSLRSAPYMSTLPLSSLRVAGTVPTQALVAEMGPIADALARRVKKARDDDEEDSADASE